MQMKKNNISKINAGTGVYCIFGNPVKHSLSPAMHNAAFRELGIDAVYVAFEAGSIKNAVAAMRELNIRGASITIPFKTSALKYADTIDPLALDIGSINTLCNDHGKICGYNTDGTGAVEALVKNGVQIRGLNALLLGNGGSARAIAFALLSGGAKVTIAGRNKKRILHLVKDIRKKHKQIDYILTDELNEDSTRKTNVIINTTPVGMLPDKDSIPIDPDLIQKEHTVFDIVYSPHATSLLKTSKSKGCKIIYGIDMLVNQGARQFEIWTGKKAPVSVMEKAVKKYLNNTVI
ncbi:MAG: shikimate dehydrogenase [Spirochaetota bacterium]